MLERRVTHLLPTALLAIVCTTLGLVWVLAPTLVTPTWPQRLGVLLGGVALVFVAIRLSFRQAADGEKSAQRYVDRLCELDTSQLQSEDSLDVLPVRQEDHVWRELCERLRERMAATARHAEEVDMARAGAEVRARRATAEREQLREVLAGLTDPVIAVDSFGEIVLTNTSAERLLNVRSEEGSHPALDQLERCQELVSVLTETRRRKSVTQRSSELSVTDPSGRQHWYRVTCRTLSDQQAGGGNDRGCQHGAVAVLSDISNLKAIQKRNAEFVSAVSHEMKTPLSSIRAYVELLVDGEADDDQTREEFLGVINSQADRLQRLVDNLLNLARIEAGVVAVNKSALSLNEQLTEAVRVLQPAAEQKEVKLTSELSELYLGVLADRDMLLQGAINLISNAVKYTRRGGEVTVRSRLRDKEVVFEVQDTGVGLSPEDRLKVFEKFYRVKKDREMAQGTGLGLPLVKHIVEDVHGGRIEVESELNQGSTFRVILPSLTQLSE